MDRPFETLWEALVDNLPTKLISILIAVVLWIAVLGSGTVEENQEVGLEVITSPDLVVSNEIPEKVSFRLAGPKAALRSALNRRYDPIRINLAGSKPGLVTHRFFSDQIRLPIGVRVTSVTPNSIILKTEAVTSKTVPIRVLSRGQPPDGLQIKTLEVIPASVKISGAESRVQSTQEVLTIPIDLSKISGSTEQEAPLDLINTSLRMDEVSPKVRVTVEGLGANFKIKNVAIKVLSSWNSRLEPKTVTALVRAAPADLRKLDNRKVFAEIRAQGRPKGQYQEAVHVVLPPNVTLVRVMPETVNLTLY